MKQFILIILSIVLSSLAVAQDITKITLDNSLKTKYLFKTFHFDNYCVFPRYDDGDTVRSFIETHEQNFQFYLSNSNDTLLVFDGKLCGGYEMGVVNVYNFKYGEPETVMSRTGKIADRKNDTIWVYTYPCCAQVINIITPFSMLTGEKLGNAHLFYSREDFAAIFPFEERANQKYQLAKDSDIHWSPFKSEDAHVPQCGSLKNIVKHAEAGTTFTLLEVSSNDWVLIRFDDFPTSEGYCLSEYHQDLIGGETFSLYGWVPVGNVRWE